MYTSKCKLWLADHDDSVYESTIVIHSMSVKRHQEVNTVTNFLKELTLVFATQDFQDSSMLWIHVRKLGNSY